MRRLPALLEGMPQPPASILLFMTDQPALHTLSCYGATVSRTPNIDALAADGIPFDHDFTPSLLTGLYPHTRDVLFNSGLDLRCDETACGQGPEALSRKIRCRRGRSEPKRGQNQRLGRRRYPLIALPLWGTTRAISDDGRVSEFLRTHDYRRNEEPH